MNRWLILTRLLSIFAAVVLFGQNCGEITLAPKLEQEEFGSIISDETPPSIFKIPPAKDYEMRVAFFVDVSASMQTRSCQNDTATDMDLGNCKDGNFGYDPVFNRLRMIEKWIEQIDEHLVEKNLPLNKLKMIFIPFSGGARNGPIISQSVPLNYQGISLYLHQKQFTSDRQKILRVIDTYRKLHFAFSDIPPNFDGMEDYGLSKDMDNYDKWQVKAGDIIRTSIPSPVIDEVTLSVNNELNAIRSANPNLLSQTRFEIAFLSDGISKPHHLNIENAVRLLWENRVTYRTYPGSGEPQGANGRSCGEYWGGGGYGNRCVFKEIDFSPNGLNCFAGCEQDLDKILITGATEYYREGLSRSCDKRCIDIVYDYLATPERNGPPKSFLDSAKQHWGDYQENYHWNIQQSIKNLEVKLREFPQVEYRFNFVRFENKMENLKPMPELLDRERNWLTQARETFKDQHRHAVADTAALPFSLFPGFSEINGYKLSHFFVQNLQARLNSAGVVAEDSDADGLFDYEEDMLGSEYDKQVARSNGHCLDAVTYKYGGCIEVGCDVEIDLDGDGLNQCDEQSLDTRDTDFDTDNDGISDLMEVLYGFNPLIDDRDQDYNGDGVSNFVNFTKGAGPWTFIEEVPENKKINLIVRETAPVETQLPSGGTALVPAYSIQLRSVPSMSNLSATGVGDMYRNVSKTSEFLNTPPFLEKTYAANKNRLVLFARVDHTQNHGDVFWIFQSIDVDYSPAPIRIGIDLQNMEPMPWRDNVGGSQ